MGGKGVANVEERRGEKMGRGEKRKKGAGRENERAREDRHSERNCKELPPIRLDCSTAVRWVMQQRMGRPPTRPRCVQRADAQRRVETWL